MKDARTGIPHLVICVLGLFTTSSAVQVTFRANTSTVPDTLQYNSVVQVRGSAYPLTWCGDSPIFLSNEGAPNNPSDYWIGTAVFPANKDIEYAFFTNARDTVFFGADWEDQGWEGTPCRTLNTGSEPTLDLPVQFVFGSEEGDPWWKPWEDIEGTFIVYVRVNMQVWDILFGLGSEVIGIRGSNTVDWGQTGEMSWSCTFPLTPEHNHVNVCSRQYSGGFFYSGAVHVPDRYAGEGIEFKTVVHNAGADLCEDWSNLVYNPPQQQFHINLTGSDTTLHWFWYDCFLHFSDPYDVIIMNVEADLANAIADNGFTSEDTIEVRMGYFGTAREILAKTMTRREFTSIYSATDTIESFIGGIVYYQYYRISGGDVHREIFHDHEYDGENSCGAEKRWCILQSDDVLIEDKVDNQSDLHRMPQFRNTRVVTQPVTVTFSCDVRSAICAVTSGAVLHDIHGTIHVGNPDSILILGCAMNGPATGSCFEQTCYGWGSHLMEMESKRMYDDGTHGDEVAGDSIFTIVFEYHPDSNDVVGLEFKFGIGGGDNEAGCGNNHVENIDDTQSVVKIASQFGSTSPPDYKPWNFDVQKCVETEFMLGDPTGDGFINILDVLAVANDILDIHPLEGAAAKAADCNGDGMINIIDALNIANIILGIIPECPGGFAETDVHPETIEFLKQLEHYLPLKEYTTLMRIVGQVAVSTTYSLGQNYPNPFNSSTDIQYHIPGGRSLLPVTLKIYNIMGQEIQIVVDEHQEAGRHTVSWDGCDNFGNEVTSGIYFYRLQTDDFTATKQMIFMK